MSEEPGLRERHKADKRARIRRAAMTLFARHGYERTTTRQIAKKAGVAAGTLFLYAKTKEDVLVLVFADEITRVAEERLGSVPANGPLLDQLMHVFTGFLDFYDRDHALSRVLVKEMLVVGRAATGRTMRLTLGFMGRLVELIAEAQVRGELAGDVPALPLASNLFAIYLGVLLARLNGQLAERAMCDGWLRASLELALRGMHA